MSKAGEASCSLASHTPITCKAGTCYCLKSVQGCSCICSCSLPPKERSNRSCENRGGGSCGTWHRGDPSLCLSASLVVGPASGVSGKLSLLTPCRGSKAEVAELSCSEASQGDHLSYPHKCSSLSGGCFFLLSFFIWACWSSLLPHRPPPQKPTA